MKVVVLSDLHIDDSSEWKKNSEEMIRRIKNITNEGERILFVFLGDIVNGFKDRKTEDIKRFYKKADGFVSDVNNGLIENDVEFYFVPGNHDLDGDSLDSFNEFVERHSRIDNRIYKYTLEESVFTFDIEDYRFILVDTNLTRDYGSNGKIDGALLKTKGATDKKIILFMHHPPSSRESYSDSDDKALDNPLDVMFLHAEFVFYGHQHGDHKDDFYIHRDTLYIPVSGLINKGSNIKNGFVVLDIQGKSITNCFQYEYDGTIFHKVMITPYKTEKKLNELLIETHDYSEELKDTVSRHYYQTSPVIKMYDLVDVVSKNDFVVITGEAGIGKTYEAHRLYQLYLKNDEYYPIMIDLRCTTKGTIERYVEYACKFRIDNKDVLLIIDGISESTSCTFNELISALINLPNQNRSVKVAITKRDNYEFNMLPPDYITFHIKGFDNEDIKEYLNIRQVQDPNAFLSIITQNDYQKLINIPFVLKAVTDIYLKDGDIPSFEELIPRIMELRFIDADTNLSNKYKIMPVEHDMIMSLEELGFVMQATNEHPIYNIHYSKLIDEKTQMLHSYTGLLYQDENYRRDFIHEIFSEYLTSDYLCNLDLSQMLDIISYHCQEKIKIKRVWYDVVRRIIDMRQNDDLLNWVIHNDNKFLIYNLPEKMMYSNESVHIVEHVLKECFSKNMPIHVAVSDVERFVKIHSSPKMWNLITKELFKSHNEYGLSTLLQILRYANSSDIEVKKVQEKLINIIEEDNHAYIKSYALSALININNNTDQYADRVLCLLNDETEISVVKEALTIIYNSNNPDAYYEYAIKMFENVDRSYISFTFDEIFLKTITSMKLLDTMIKSIRYMCESEIFDRIHNSINIFEFVINRITQIVIEEQCEEVVFEQMYDCFLKASHHINVRKTGLIKCFFAKVGKIEEVLKKVIEENNLNFYSSFESIIDTDLMEILIKYYNENIFTEERFEWYINRYSVSDRDLDKLKAAYKQKNGKEIVLFDKSAWSINHTVAEREYFRSLFDKHLFECKVFNLIGLFNQDIPISEFFGKWFSTIPDDKQDLQMIGGLIHRNVDDSSLHFLEFLSNYNWKNLQFCALLEFIESRDKSELELDENQLEFLKGLFYQILERTNFEIDEYRSMESMKIRFVTALITKLDFKCDDEKLLEMLMLPWYLFASSTANGSDEVVQFIQNYISDSNKLYNRVIYNLENKNLNTYAKGNHISYCLENGLPNAVSVAESLFQSTEKEAEYLKNIVIRYLLKFQGEEYVDNLISEKTEDSVLEYLSSLHLTHNSKLVHEMITRNEKSSDYFLFIRDLIILNNEFGLKKYCDYVKNNNKIPELSDQKYSHLDITLQVRRLNKICLIDQIVNLLLIAYSKDFVDKDDFWGLKGSLDNVLLNMCKENPEQTKHNMKRILSSNEISDELLFKCNYYIAQCDVSLTLDKEDIWTFEKALRFVCERRID